MIKTIIFDFGDVFINLDKPGTIKRTKDLLGFDIITEAANTSSQAIFETNDAYEKGEISTDQFLSFYTNRFKGVTKNELIDLWNSLIKDFPKYRLDWLKQLKAEHDFKFILLSNTNALHINYIKEDVAFYEEFKACFDKFYLSHEIHLRKPNADIYEFVLSENKLKAEECLFIDDTKANTDTASALGINTWNIDETSQDVIDLFHIKANLF